jgi:hypothetical protein
MRVVAITLDASLGAALNMIDEWEVVSARSVDDAVRSAGGASVVLVGVGATDAGIQVAQEIYARGVTLPSIVVGDALAPAGARVPVLIRPFSLDDLRNAVAAAERGDLGQAQESAVVSAPGDEITYEEPEPEMPLVDPEPDPVSHEVEADLSAEDDLLTSASSNGAVLDPDAELYPSEEGWKEIRVEAVEEAPWGIVALEAPNEEFHPAEHASSLRLVREELAKPEPDTEPERTPEPPFEPAAYQPASAPRTGAAPLPAIPQEAIVAEPAPRIPAAYEEPPRRRFGRRGPAPTAPPVEETAESELLRHLRAGVGAARDLEHLIDQLPMLNDLPSMAEALVGEVASTFFPETASVFVRDGEEFHNLASQGLTNTERRMRVSVENPLFRQVLTSLESILIAPVDLAAGLVAGIGGARTEALMAAPVEVDGNCVAILVVGRKDFDGGDLQRLDDLAREAGAGIAVAGALDRLRHRT